MNVKFNPKKYRLLKYLIKDSFAVNNLDNTFSIFKSINNIIFLIYSNREGSIISYDLIKNKKINEIINSHKKPITNFRHHLDKKNNRDLLLSISGKDYNIKVWNINNFECILTLKNIHIFHSKNYQYRLNSACFLTDKNQTYIITSDCSDFLYSSISDPIRIYDLNGNKINEIKDSNYNTLFIDTFFDEKFSKYYIISGNFGFVESYDFNNNKIYHKYIQNNYTNNNNTYCYESIIINYLDDIKNEKSILKLIASCSDGYIKIWNFHSGEIFKLIKVFGVFLHSICLLNYEYLAVACGDNSIKILDINKGKLVKVLIVRNEVNCIKSIILPSYGICLISQEIPYFLDKNNEYIKLYSIIENNYL